MKKLILLLAFVGINLAFVGITANASMYGLFKGKGLIKPAK